MALADHLKYPPTRRPAPCAVGRILSALSEEDQALLTDRLADPDWQTTTITNALAAEGHRVARSTVLTHRRGVCGCGSV